MVAAETPQLRRPGVIDEDAQLGLGRLVAAVQGHQLGQRARLLEQQVLPARHLVVVGASDDELDGVTTRAQAGQTSVAHRVGEDAGDLASLPPHPRHQLVGAGLALVPAARARSRSCRCSSRRRSPLPKGTRVSTRTASPRVEHGEEHLVFEHLHVLQGVVEARSPRARA